MKTITSAALPAPWRTASSLVRPSHLRGADMQPPWLPQNGSGRKGEEKMNLSNCAKWMLALLFLFAVSPAGAVEVGEAGCYVLELPAVISEPGHYCLERDWDLDFPWGGMAIEIRSDHVVVDFQGHQVRHLPGLVVGGLGSTTYGVYAWNQSHIVVRNGALAGFRRMPAGTSRADG
jgi:hypothetical protein